MGPKPNPSYEPWSPEDQQVYLREAFEAYRRKHGDPRPEPYSWYDRWRGNPPPEPHKVKVETMTRLYEEGRLFGVLRMSFREFVDTLVYKTGWRACAFRWRSDYPHWYVRHGVGYRERMSYRRKAEHVRKAEEPGSEAWYQEEHRRAWREAHLRDKAKAGRWNRGWKRWAKHFSNREHRRWEQRAIRSDRTEELFSVIPKHYFDPWRWD